MNDGVVRFFYVLKDLCEIFFLFIVKRYYNWVDVLC